MAKTTTEKLAKALRANLKRRKERANPKASLAPPKPAEQPAKGSG